VNDAPNRLSGFTVPDFPMVRPGDDLARQIVDAVRAAGEDFEAGDVVCLAQKIVSKAEGRQVALSAVTPSARAEQLARETGKDPRLVQLILDESSDLLRQKPGVLIMRHRLGLVGAHAGIDQSNIEHGADGDHALLLPEDPDHSAAALRTRLMEATGVPLAVLITDSANRPWRLGTVGIAIGAAGMTVLADHRGGRDLYGRELRVTLINRADAIATFATLLMGETTERTPVAIVRGLPAETGDLPADGATARAINRPLEEDLFR